ncbi:MAG TPA: hypothetical protein VN878_03930, partial [Usitatibacter sp.]|nr:hypothetical protein [Usitatibacter sp.]
MNLAPLRAWLSTYRPRLLALFMGVLIPLYLFVSMAEEVWDHDGFALDEKILTFAHGLASPTLNTLMAFFSKIGGALVMVPFEIAIVFTLMLL